MKLLITLYDIFLLLLIRFFIRIIWISVTKKSVSLLLDRTRDYDSKGKLEILLEISVEILPYGGKVWEKFLQVVKR